MWYNIITKIKKGKFKSKCLITNTIIREVVYG